MGKEGNDFPNAIFRRISKNFLDFFLGKKIEKASEDENRQERVERSRFIWYSVLISVQSYKFFIIRQWIVDWGSFQEEVYEGCCLIGGVCGTKGNQCCKFFKCFRVVYFPLKTSCLNLVSIIVSRSYEDWYLLSFREILANLPFSRNINKESCSF